MHSNAKIIAWVALAYATTSLASMTVIPFDLENRRDREVIIHVKHFRTEPEARSANIGESAKGDLSVGRIRLKAGEKTLISGGSWVKWCQVSPPSSLPCDVLDLRSTGANVILE